MAKYKRGQRCKRGMEVQTILFDRKRFTAAKARKWLKDHDFKAPKVDKGDKFLRFRQKAPKSCKFFRFGKAFEKGVRPVYCCPK